MRLIIPVLLNCFLVLGLYLADKHTPARKLPHMAKQGIVGILFGLLLCLVQQELGLISTGGSGDFIMDSYPVRVVWSDVAMVFVTVLVTGAVAVWLPVRLLTKKYI